MHAVALFGPVLLLRLQTLFSRVSPDLLLLSNPSGLFHCVSPVRGLK